MRGPIVTALLAAALGGCTQPNPTFVADGGATRDVGWTDGGVLDGAGPWTDGPIIPPTDGPRLDSPSSRDVLPPPDLAPPPDVVPWQCVTDADCNDQKACTQDSCTAAKICASTLLPGFCLIGGKCLKQGDTAPLDSCKSCQPQASTTSWTPLPDGSPCADDPLTCTADVCKAGACAHPVAPGTCLIGGVCYGDGQANPQNPCQTCQPAASTSQWTTAPDKTPCAADKLSCTEDQCIGGKCEHPLSAGWCLIAGTCRAEGSSPGSDVCNECVTDVSQTAWTFVDGKPCSSGTGIAQMCYAGKCHGWTESDYEPPASEGPKATALNGVDFIPPAKAVWAAGEYESSNAAEPMGLLVPLGGASALAPVTAKAPLKGIQRRLAVGDQAQAWYHDGTKWVTSSSITTFLGTAGRTAVHGYPVPTGELFFLGGTHDSSPGGIGGVVRCAITPLGTACNNQGGFASDSHLGGLYAAPSNLGLQGPAWAINVELAVNGPEDIYAYPGSGNNWSTNPPAGCKDSSNTPCSNTYGAFSDVYGSSPSDVWVVGSYGNLLHYDGTKWNRLSNVVQFQSYQVMTGVYSSPADKLVSIISYRVSSSYRWVSIYHHNTALDRWFGPLTISQGSDNGVDELRDIGGDGYGNLWAVGRREVSSGSGGAKVKGWVLHLQ